MDRRSIGSWLGGPTSGDDAAGAAGGAVSEYPGQRLGLPKEGTWSAPGLPRRVVALMVDWVLSSAIGYGLLQGGPWLTLLVFAVENVLLVGTLGCTIGHRLLGFRVVRVDRSPVGPLWALVRTLLLCAFVPALFVDGDRRGLHDRASNTMTVRY